MRIAFDHEVFSNQIYGGVSRYFVELAKSLSRAGSESKIFCPLHSNIYLEKLSGDLVSGRSSNFPFLSRQRIRFAYNAWRNKSQFKHFRPELIHHTYYTITERTKGTDCPRVITIHDMIPELFPEYFGDCSETIWVKRNAAEKADHVICVSHRTREDVLRLYDLKPDKVSVVHHGVRPTELSGHLNAETGRKFFLYVGQRDGYKNFGLLVEAYCRSGLSEDFDLVAFGGGAFTPAELQHISSFGISQGRVRHESGDDRALASHYSNAFAFIYPSLYEGFGLPPLEAMAQGCPVISSNTSSMPEVVGEAGEYFCPSEPDDLIRAMTLLVDSDSHRLNLIEAGHQRIKHFSWDRTARETLAVYQNLLA